MSQLSVHSGPFRSHIELWNVKFLSNQSKINTLIFIVFMCASHTITAQLHKAEKAEALMCIRFEFVFPMQMCHRNNKCYCSVIGVKHVFVLVSADTCTSRRCQSTVIFTSRAYQSFLNVCSCIEFT